MKYYVVIFKENTYGCIQVELLADVQDEDYSFFTTSIIDGAASFSSFGAADNFVKTKYSKAKICVHYAIIAYAGGE